MSDTVEPLTNDAWDPLGEPVYEVPEVDWRHDPTLHSLLDNESATGLVAPSGAPEGREVAIVVLVEGHPTAVPMTRAEAIEAGHTVLDVDTASANDSLESENVPTTSGRSVCAIDASRSP